MEELNKRQEQKIFEIALNRLIDSELVHQDSKVTKPNMPIKARFV